MATGHDGHSQSLKVYFWVWLWLFILSACSYFVDISDLPDMVKWVCITIFMLLKAGLIMAIFMHMQLERWSMNLVVLAPPIVLMVALAIFALEANYTLSSRLQFFAN